MVFPSLLVIKRVIKTKSRQTTPETKNKRFTLFKKKKIIFLASIFLVTNFLVEFFVFYIVDIHIEQNLLRFLRVPYFVLALFVLSCYKNKIRSVPNTL